MVKRRKLSVSALLTRSSAASNVMRRSSPYQPEQDIRRDICFPNTDRVSSTLVGLNRGRRAALNPIHILLVSCVGRRSNIVLVCVFICNVMDLLQVHQRYDDLLASSLKWLIKSNETHFPQHGCGFVLSNWVNGWVADWLIIDNAFWTQKAGPKKPLWLFLLLLLVLQKSLTLS